MAHTSHIRFTPRAQKLCTAHGLWLNDQPQAALAALLANSTRSTNPMTGALYYECDPAQVDALLTLLTTMHQAMRTAGRSRADGSAIAQWQRRIRESSGKAPPAWRPQPRPAQPVAATAPLFTPPPTEAKAKVEYELHVMKTLRDLVDFSQSSAY